MASASMPCCSGVERSVVCNRDGNRVLLLPRYENDVCDDCPQLERKIKVNSESMKIVQVWIIRSIER
jgi:hypothetical protein